MATTLQAESGELAPTAVGVFVKPETSAKPDSFYHFSNWFYREYGKLLSAGSSEILSAYVDLNGQLTTTPRYEGSYIELGFDSRLSEEGIHKWELLTRTPSGFTAVQIEISEFEKTCKRYEINPKTKLFFEHEQFNEPETQEILALMRDLANHDFVQAEKTRLWKLRQAAQKYQSDAAFSWMQTHSDENYDAQIAMLDKHIELIGFRPYEMFEPPKAA